ncbi:hypothetical protein J2W48_000550 [Flavobacterium piscis]|uniref:Uncharacterized protein n=1 Tax=Flavobacterium piscis TaxID=1114874 RepID=A0ABU1Y325_9FLAO|nr:hypothetical protein [Flavobacterium piscis]
MLKWVIPENCSSQESIPFYTFVNGFTRLLCFYGNKLALSIPMLCFFVRVTQLYQSLALFLGTNS